jgi:predicted DCC family thiol-disulfide oxidoreductase YuxK
MWEFRRGLSGKMMYFKKIRENLFKKTDAAGLSVFRMCYSLVLFFEILQQYRFSELIYNENPYVSETDFSMQHLFACWMIVLFLLFIGLFTRFAVVLNYLFTLLVFSRQHYFEYHIFGIYVGVNFLLLFIPVSKVLSLDHLLEKLKYSSVGKFYAPERRVYAVNYFAPVLIAIGLVYFDSVLFKIESPMWQKGLGMWLPASLPFAVWNDLGFLMNNEFIVKSVGYIVIAFEFAFVFLMWFKKFRVPLFLTGVLFHVGILLCFPIPWFALATIAVYLLMLPAGAWKKTGLKRKPVFNFYYDAECPLCIKTVVVIRHFDIFKRIECKSVQGSYPADAGLLKIPEEKMLLEIYSYDKKSGKVSSGYDTYVQLLIRMGYTSPLGYLMKLPLISRAGRALYKKVAAGRGVYRCTHETCNVPVFSASPGDDEPVYVSWLTRNKARRKLWKALLGIILLVQLLTSLFAACPVLLRKKLPGYTVKTENLLNRVTLPLRSAGVFFIGIKNHPLFLDAHFRDYNEIIRITCSEGGREVTLPIINDKGMPGRYIQGPFWTNFTFRVWGASFDRERFDAGIKRYLLYWLAEQKKDLFALHTFKVYVKQTDIPSDWEADFLEKQLSKPWRECGYIKLQGKNIVSSIAIDQ